MVSCLRVVCGGTNVSVRVEIEMFVFVFVLKGEGQKEVHSYLSTCMHKLRVVRATLVARTRRASWVSQTPWHLDTFRHQIHQFFNQLVWIFSMAGKPDNLTVACGFFLLASGPARATQADGWRRGGMQPCRE